MEWFSCRFYQRITFRYIAGFVLLCFFQTFVFPPSFAKAISSKSPSQHEEKSEVSTSDFFTPSMNQKSKKVDLDLPIAASLEITSNSLPLSSLTEISDALRWNLRNSKKFLVYSRSEMQQALNHTLNEERVAVRQINQFVN